MNCPVCGQPMSVLHVHGIELDRCETCQGVWFDYDEMNRYLLRNPDATLVSPRSDVESLLVQRNELTELSCPRCGDMRIERGSVHGLAFLRCEVYCGVFMTDENILKAIELDPELAPVPPFGLFGGEPSLAKAAANAAGETAVGGAMELVLYYSMAGLARLIGFILMP